MKIFTLFVLFFSAGLMFAQQWPDQPVLRRAGSGPIVRQAAAPAADQIPQEREPAVAPPPFASLSGALAHIGGQPIAVAEVKPHDPYRQDRSGFGPAIYGASRAQRAVFGGFGLGVGGGCNGYHGGYLGGYGGLGYDLPVYSDVDPSATLGSVIQTRLTQELKLKGARPIASATGFGAGALEAINIEAGTGKNAGVWGNHTQETARYVLAASFAIVDEDVQIRGFDGCGPAQAAQRVSWRVGNRTAHEIIGYASDGLSQIQVQRQHRKVTAVLFVYLLDINRDLLYAGEGRGTLNTRELSIVNIAGVQSVALRHPNAELLARQMVAAVFDQPPTPTQP